MIYTPPDDTLPCQMIHTRRSRYLDFQFPTFADCWKNNSKTKAVKVLGWAEIGIRTKGKHRFVLFLKKCGKYQKKFLKSIDLSSGRGGYHLEKESIICRGCVSSGRGG
jgi:hypothetical protein